jgi:hypothetical protein
MLELLKNANLALAFALELAMLAAYATWALGLDASPWMRWTLAAVLVIAAIAIWGVWAAAHSSRRLRMPGLLVLKLALFGLAVAALATSRHERLAASFGGLVVLNLALAAAWDQQ